MPVKDFRLPDPGEGLTEAELVTWRVAVGDTVKVNDIVVEIETAKSLVELPVPFAGTVTALLVGEGETVEVGTPIISVDTGGSAPAPDATAVATAPAEGAVEPGMVGSPAPKVTSADGEPEIEEGKIGGTTSTGRTAVLVGYGVKQTEAKRRPRKDAGLPIRDPDEFVPAPERTVGEHTSRSARTGPGGVAALTTTPGAGRALAKPPVRKLAKDLGVGLDQVAGSGEGGTITRTDVESHAANGADEQGANGHGPTPATSDREGSSLYAPLSGQRYPANSRGETRIPVKGVRKMTAQAMVASAFTAPHVTEWVTVDVTATMELVENLKRDRDFREVKVTPLLVLAKALCLALRRNPGMNAAWDEQAQEVVVKHYVNLGLAAATPRGLLVPNIKDADQMSMLQLANEIGELTRVAREGRTQPADMAGGTVTITNVGVFGVDSGTPILNPGESAIVCFGAIRKQPWVVTNAAGDDEIAIRHVTQLAVAFDHRLIDGELGSRFLADLAAIMADPSKGLVWG